MSDGWIATAEGVEAKDIPAQLEMGVGDRRNKGTKAQFEAGAKAAQAMAAAFDGPVNINASGAEGQMQVTVVGA